MTPLNPPKCFLAKLPSGLLKKKPYLLMMLFFLQAEDNPYNSLFQFGDLCQIDN